MKEITKPNTSWMEREYPSKELEDYIPKEKHAIIFGQETVEQEWINRRENPPFLPYERGDECPDGAYMIMLDPRAKGIPKNGFGEVSLMKDCVIKATRQRGLWRSYDKIDVFREEDILGTFQGISVKPYGPLKGDVLNAYIAKNLLPRSINFYQIRKEQELPLYEIVCICGKTCSGKDTLARRMAESHGWEEVVSYTNRPMRIGEHQGHGHYFIKSAEEFDRRLKEETVVSYYEVDAQRKYFASIEALPKGRCIYVNNPSSIVAMKKWFDERTDLVDIRVLFLDIPEEVLLKRAALRGDDMEKVKERLKVEEEEFARENAIKSFKEAGILYSVYSDTMADMTAFAELERLAFPYRYAAYSVAK